MDSKPDIASSAGHKLGQLIGDWFEKYFVLPLLAETANRLELFLDSRFKTRSSRGERIVWQDADENTVDYDFVLELGGTDQVTGLPVAFVECFWRRGARHSKDKARDDSGKLSPMRTTYPTARFLGIVAAGDFTSPARDLVRSRDIDLFYVPKNQVVQAFMANKLVMDYPDKATEAEKLQLATAFATNFTEEKHTAVANTLAELVGKAGIVSYVDRMRARLSALPQEIQLVLRHESAPLTFYSVTEATQFLANPHFTMQNPTESYLYHVIYSDGTEFEQSAASLQKLKELHNNIQQLSNHINRLASRR